MENIRVVVARRGEAVGLRARVQGWVRTRRDSKAGFSFVEMNDGSCLSNLLVIADANLLNYESEIKRLGPGCSVARSAQSPDLAETTDRTSPRYFKTPPR